jgi:hypothetical protein
MSGVESILMEYLNVYDLVDYILRKNIETDRINVTNSLSAKFANNDIVLQTTADEFFDMFHSGACIMIPKGNDKHTKEIHDIAFDLKWAVIQALKQSESKLSFLEEVTKSNSAVFSKNTVTCFMRKAIDYSHDMM